MTLDGHIKTGLAAALFMTAALPAFINIPSEIFPICIVLFFLGNLAPDLLEFKVIPHRTITHYPWLYIIALIGCYLAITNGQTSPYLYAGLTFSLGALNHIICDIPYGRIPYLNPMKGVTLMRVQFDSITNRIIEHTVLISFLVGYLLFSTELSTWVSDFATTVTSSDFSIQQSPKPDTPNN